jgi:hypothetical protein
VYVWPWFDFDDFVLTVRFSLSPDFSEAIF